MELDGLSDDLFDLLDRIDDIYETKGKKKTKYDLDHTEQNQEDDNNWEDDYNSSEGEIEDE